MTDHLVPLATRALRQPILALWAVPRSTSTAFEWMMRMRNDHTCFHEPLGEVWYQGETPLWPRATPDSVRTPGLTFASRWAELLDAAEAGPVFIKDFALYLDSLWTDEFLAHFTHSFLIRDPLASITSMHRRWPDFHDKEVGLVEQRQLFDRLWERDGHPPPVIDSDDVLADPATVVEAWCEAVDIPFIAQALSWEPGPRDEVSWWDGGSFHETLRNSNGLEPQPAAPLSLDDVPPRVVEAHARVIDDYRYLHQHRLSPT